MGSRGAEKLSNYPKFTRGRIQIPGLSSLRAVCPLTHATTSGTTAPAIASQANVSSLWLQGWVGVLPSQPLHVAWKLLFSQEDALSPEEGCPPVPRVPWAPSSVPLSLGALLPVGLTSGPPS